jgi:hypothetical protein
MSSRQGPDPAKVSPISTTASRSDLARFSPDVSQRARRDGWDDGIKHLEWVPPLLLTNAPGSGSLLPNFLSYHIALRLA